MYFFTSKASKLRGTWASFALNISRSSVAMIVSTEQREQRQYLYLSVSICTFVLVKQVN